MRMRSLAWTSASCNASSRGRWVSVGCNVRSIGSSDMGWFRSSAQALGTSRGLSEITVDDAIAGTNTPS
jgi:hypothetical protein